MLDTTKAVDLEFPAADVLVILAAAGNGKTTRLMQELVDALDTYRPDEIALATFTRKGVAVAMQRALSAVPGITEKDLPYFGTFHKLFFKSLGLTGKNIIERKDIEKFNNLLGFNVHLSAAFDNQTEDDKLIQRYDSYRSGNATGVYVESLCDEDRYTRLINAYEAFKAENNLLDYHDVLLRYKDEGEPLNVKVALMDEFQDSTKLQCECIQKAFGHCERVRIVGDDYQTIFSFAGAVPETLIHLSNKYPTIKLEKSYRLPKAIYNFSRNITTMITNKVDKDFYPVKTEDGSVDIISDRKLLAKKIARSIEKSAYKPASWYLLFRANCFISSMADILEDAVVPYYTNKGFCLDKNTLTTISRYYKYKNGLIDSKKAMRRFMEKYNIASFDDDFTESNIIQSNKRFMYFDYVEKYGVEKLLDMVSEEPCVLLTTTYKVKGGEADNVAVFMDATRIVCENMVSDLDSELRVMYVACTRAKEKLFLVSSESQYGLDGIIEVAYGGFYESA